MEAGLALLLERWLFRFGFAGRPQSQTEKGEKYLGDVLPRAALAGRACPGLVCIAPLGLRSVFGVPQAFGTSPGLLPARWAEGGRNFFTIVVFNRKADWAYATVFI